jgi:hypothetical protein
MPPTPVYKSDCKNVEARLIASLFEIVVAQHAAPL